MPMGCMCQDGHGSCVTDENSLDESIDTMPQPGSCVMDEKCQEEPMATMPQAGSCVMDEECQEKPMAMDRTLQVELSITDEESLYDTRDCTPKVMSAVSP